MYLQTNFIRISLAVIMNDVIRDPSPLPIVTNQADWDSFVAREHGHLLQTFAWGELKSRFGWRALRVAMIEHGEICSGAQVLVRRLLPGLALAYVPRGPISPDPSFVQALVETMRRQGVFLLKLEPNWLNDDSRNGMLDGAGFLHSTDTVQPPVTTRIDLSPSHDAILGAMKPKWRYNIRLSEKRGVIVREGTLADLPAFYELTLITAGRDKFAVHPLAYYKNAFQLLTERGNARLFVAEFEGRALAMVLAAAFADEAVYFYGASGNQDRNAMPNHALHWAAIRWAKVRGCRWYDMWGVPQAKGKVPSSNEAGERTSHLPDSLYQFKQGFGGKTVSYTGAWDMVFSPTHHAIYRLARRVRKRGFA